MSPDRTPRAPIDNPLGTDGFEFVEYTAPDPELLRTLFERLGFPATARHRSKNVTLHRQGDINFIINAEPDSFGQRFARQHGPSACAMAFPRQGCVVRFPSLRRARREARARRASARWSCRSRRSRASAAASSISSIATASARSTTWTSCRCAALRPPSAGLTYIDHLTHNVCARQHEQVGRLLREAVQLPRDPLLRHRRQEDRPVQPRHDQPVRQDPHSDQRIAGRQVADRGVPARVPRRRHPAHRARHDRHLRDGRRAARPGRAVPGHAGHLLRRRRRARAGPSREAR